MKPICQSIFEKFSFLIKILKNLVTQVKNWVLMPHVPEFFIFFKWVIFHNRWQNVTWFIWRSSMRTKETNSYKHEKKNFYCSKIYLTIKLLLTLYEKNLILSEKYFSFRTKKSLQSQRWTTNGWSMIKKAD